jgi:putative tryptophan/tyrosine transport system substrate-binding protein
MPNWLLDLRKVGLELLKEAIPGISRMGVLISTKLAEGHAFAFLAEVAHKVGVSLVGPPLATPIQEPEYSRVFMAMSDEHADALILFDQGEHFQNRWVIARLADEFRFYIGLHQGFTEAGVLVGYGIDIVSLFRIAATQIDQIRKGASPGGMPIQRNLSRSLT